MKKKDFILSSALKLKGEGAKWLDLQVMERSSLIGGAKRLISRLNSQGESAFVH